MKLQYVKLDLKRTPKFQRILNFDKMCETYINTLLIQCRYQMKAKKTPNIKIVVI